MFIQRDSIHQYIEKVLREGELWKPDIFLVQKDGKRAIIKDYLSKPFFFRFFIGIFSTRREAYIYSKLRGLPGIPHCLGLVDRYAIAVAYIPGRNASELDEGELSPHFFKKLREIIDSIHDRGVVLCDLRNIKNVILGDDGEPYLIDFSTAFQKGGRFNFFKNGLYRIFFQDDLLGIAKLKKNKAIALLTEEERMALEKGVFLQKEAIYIKLKGRSFLKRLFGIGRVNAKNQKSDIKRIQ
jgi:predicted Ser/Thr protein kinase